MEGKQKECGLFFIPFILLMGTFFFPKEVAAQLKADFSANVQEGCLPVIVRFQDMSAGNPDSYEWNFGNGNTSALENPNASYSKPGKYQVSLKIKKGDEEDVVIKKDYIVVFDTPAVAKPLITPSSGCFPLEVKFQDFSKPGSGATLSKWVWDFGDGNTSKEPSPIYTYKKEGEYDVSLAVTNSDGCSSGITLKKAVSVKGNFQLNFSADPPFSCSAPLEVQFDATTDAPSPKEYRWNFGDGKEGTGVNPTHTYEKPGNYSVRLEITSGDGCVNSLKKNKLVQVGTILTDFVIPQGCEKSVMEFKNASSQAPDSSHWDFGDGTVGKGVNTTHTYAAAGDFTVTLTNYYGDCEIPVKKTVQVVPVPQAKFTVDETEYCSWPAIVHFKNESTDYSSSIWTFGDGTTSQDKDPVHSYWKRGVFDVKLQVENDFGCSSTVTEANYIKALNPEVNFSVDTPDICENSRVRFTNNINSPSPVTSYSWDFGDGSTSTEANPSHVYTKTGAYDVKLKVTTDSGCENETVKSKFVRVGSPVDNDFTTPAGNICVSTPVSFILDHKLPDNIIYNWYFPNDSNSTETGPDPVHIFNSLYDQDVILEINNNGCKTSVEKKNLIYINPPLALMEKEGSCDDPYTVVFKDKSIEAKTWKWDFGDGNTFNGQTPPPHQYTKTGEYIVTLTVQNGDCSSTVDDTVHIIDLNPVLSLPTTDLCKKEEIQLSAQNSADSSLVASYLWKMGDGNEVNTTDPVFSYRYVQSGDYDIQLQTTDIKGCVRESNKLKVFVNGPDAKFNLATAATCAGTDISFDDLSTSANSVIHTWKWYFGDGDSSIQDAGPAMHSYVNGGSYDVKLVVIDEDGCTDTAFNAQKTMIYTSLPDFVVSDTALCPNGALTWKNTTAGNIVSYQWDFGDGTTSNLRDPDKTYSSEGDYLVTLRTETKEGCVGTKQQEMIVREPVAEWDYEDNAAECPPFIVDVSNLSKNYSRILWDFGDGATSESTDTVGHIYKIPGNYRLRMIAFGYSGDCADTVSKDIFIPGPYGVPHLSDSAGCAPYGVQFSVAAVNALSAFWDFGDGEISKNGVNEVVNHVFTQPMISHPNLILEDDRNCKVTIPIKNKIIVDGGSLDPVAKFSDICDSTVVTFDPKGNVFSDKNLGFPLKYSWAFGDPSTDENISSEKVPTFQYPGPGNYTASLQAESEYGCVFDETVQVTVPEPYVMHLSSMDDTTVCAGTAVTLSAEGADRYVWTSSLGNQSNDQYYNIIATSDAEYKVVGYSAGDCQMDSGFVQVNVNKIPEITLSADTTVPTGSIFTIPVRYSSDAQIYEWTSLQDDLSCLHCPYPTAEPRLPSIYKVKVTNQWDCTDSASMRVFLACSNAHIFIPNTFTPNNDGMNDIFYPRGRGVSEIRSFQIFDRWGNLIFEKRNFQLNDISSGWDGTFKGKMLNPGVFVYQAAMICDGGKEFQLKGDITLLR